MDFKDVSREISQVADGYRYHKPPALLESARDFLAQLLRKIMQIIHDLFQRHGGTSDARSMSGVIQFAVYLCGVLAVFALFYLLLKQMKSSVASKTDTVRGAREVEALLDANGWKAQADKLAAVQEYKPACRAIYLSLLQNMHEHHIAEFAPAKTNFEYSYSLAKYPDIQLEFRKLSDLVEVIWFGNKEATRDDYDQSVTFLAQVDKSIEYAAAKAAAKQAGT